MIFAKTSHAMLDELANHYANAQADGKMAKEEVAAEWDRILSLDDFELTELWESTFNASSEIVIPDERLFRWAEESR